MGNKQDIGKLFEKKLGAGGKIPKESLWEKINTTLDEEKRKRRRILFYWWLGGGISFLVGLFLLFNTENFTNKNPNNSIDKNLPEQKSLSNSEKEKNERSIQVSEVDSLKFQITEEENYKEGEVSEFEDDLRNNPTKNTEKASAKTSQKKIQKGNSKGKNFDETYTVSEKYYYYNSKDGKQIITENKGEIDSLVSQHYKNLDSMATKKNDSIKK